MSCVSEPKIVCTINTEQEAVTYLQYREIIPSKKNCEKCGNMMNMIFSNANATVLCQRKFYKCKMAISIRTGTWLEGSRVHLHKIVYFILSWTKKLTTIKFVEENIGMGRNSAVNFNNYLREVCAHALRNERQAIGGENCIVEIDESLFSKRKNNKGRMLKESWVFGSICRETKEVFLIQVENRTKEVLLSEICKYIRPGSTIISDMWPAYAGIGKIEGYKYVHFTVNHSENFVDPGSGADTQMVESMWHVVKYENKKRCGTHRHMLESYLEEFMWRCKHRGEDLVYQIYADMKNFQNSEDFMYKNE